MMGFFGKKKPKEMKEQKNEHIVEPPRAEDFIPRGMEMPMRKEMPKFEEETHEDFQMQRPMQQEEGRPIFIKLDDYKDAIHTLDIIKARLRETEKILNEISNLRREEDRELENWKSDLERMKEK